MLTTIKIVVDLLVRGEYGTLESMTRGVRLSAPEMERAVTEYGRTLVRPPESGWALMDVYSLDGCKFPAWSVDVPLWTEEEGESDLTLQLTLIEFSQGLFRVEIRDIHVL